MSVHAAEMQSLAQKLWGNPNPKHSTRDDLRFGSHGSKSLRPKDGKWFDHEAGQGGGYVALYEKVHGRPPEDPDILATYDYCDPSGRLLFEVVRRAPKKFVQRRPDLIAGGWIWDLKGVQRVPYRLPELLTADPAEPVFIPEGEKDVDALRERGLIATTNSGGAGKWHGSYGERLRGRHVVILPDNDDVGRDHAADVARKLKLYAASVRVLPLPNLPEKGDVSDWLAAGGTAELLMDMLTAADDAEEQEAAKPSTEADASNELPGLRNLLSIEAWAERDIPPPDRLLGDLITTTTRMFIVGRTGLGKTLFGLAAAIGMALGIGFLHWRSARPARVLYIDGEMPGELIKARAIDALRRADRIQSPGYLAIFGRDLEEEIARQFPTLGRLEPLNTEAGQNYVGALIKALGGVDVVIFDNVMSLIAGDQKDEAPWSETLPLIASLTTKRIGQMWLDHTGHNSDRQYGSSTKSWRFDTVGIMTPLPEDERRPYEVAFTLSFEHPGKARRRTPDNWPDFDTAVVRLRDDQWTSGSAGDHASGGTQGKVPPARVPFYDALVAAISRSSVGIGRTMLGAWELECLRRGLIEPPSGQENYRQRDARYRAFRKAKSDLLAAKWLAIEDDMVLDLKGRWA